MHFAADYLLVVGLAAIITATILRDHDHRRGGYLFWLAGLASTLAGMALAAVTDLQENRPVHAGVTAGIAVLAVVLVVATRRRRA